MSARHDFRILPSALPGIEIVAADSTHAFGRHMHEEFGIGLIERGAQKSASGRGVVQALAGDVITVNPGEVHDGKPFDERGRRWRMAYIAPAQMADAVSDMTPGSDFEFTAPVLRDAAVAQRLHDLFDAAAWSLPLQADAALLALTAPLLRPRDSTRPPVTAGVIAAREGMDDDPAATPTLAAMAHDAGLSRHQFLRAFTRLTGLPPHAYLLQRRVQRARQLIRRGLSLADAAAASGFADQSHMTRCFVRNFGLTPGATRRA